MPLPQGSPRSSPLPFQLDGGCKDLEVRSRGTRRVHDKRDITAGGVDLVRFYHRTTREAAYAILRKGFREGTGTYLTRKVWRGVWICDVPLDANEGAKGDILLEVLIPIELVKPYEWVEEGKSYREFLVPARILNAHATVRLSERDMNERLTADLWQAIRIVRRFLE